jgi:hypothetical protein
MIFAFTTACDDAPLSKLSIAELTKSALPFFAVNKSQKFVPATDFTSTGLFLILTNSIFISIIQDLHLHQYHLLMLQIQILSIPLVKGNK